MYDPLKLDYNYFNEEFYSNDYDDTIKVELKHQATSNSPNADRAPPGWVLELWQIIGD